MQGNLVRFTTDTKGKNVPTAVLVHGILGSRRNLYSFAKKIVEVGAWLSVFLVAVEHALKSCRQREIAAAHVPRSHIEYSCTEVACMCDGRAFPLGKLCWWT